MKRLSLQWRITLMSVLLIGITCVAMNLLLCSSGVYYMDTIADSLQGGSTVILNEGGAASFDPELIAPNEELTIVVDGAQGNFCTTNWYITAVVTLLSGMLTKKGATYQNVYFPSDGEAGKFTANIFTYPTTYVVDRSGNIVGEPIVGAITEKKQAETLQKLIDQALAADMG